MPTVALERAADAAIPRRYVRRPLERRTGRLAAIAEGEGWRRFLE